MFSDTTFDISRYLKRVRLEQLPDRSPSGLAQLMTAQLRHIPFENLDVQAGVGVSLAPQDVIEKILGRGRGGYCYEVNGLFSMALQAMNIPYQWIAARPMFYPARRPRTHMAVVALLDEGPYLCDLGFGSWGPTLPIPLCNSDQETCTAHDRFKITRSEKDAYILQAWVNGAWVSQYGFDLAPQEWVDFEPANHLNSTHPDAIFVKQVLVILHTAMGRKVLSGNRLKVFDRGQCTERVLSEAEVDECLQHDFCLPPLQRLRGQLSGAVA